MFDLHKILSDTCKIQSWDVWNDFESLYFNFEEDNESRDQYDFKVQLEGFWWLNIYSTYKVSGKEWNLFEYLRDEIFRKLEPIKFEENMNHPEWYGKVCYYCR